MKVNDIVRLTDSLGIVLFLILTVYFYNIKEKTKLEYFLLFCVTMGLIIDSTFVFDYIYGINS